jgi:hypothetical protein
MKTLTLNRKNRDKPELDKLDSLVKSLESLAISSKKTNMGEASSKVCRVASLEELKSESTILRMNDKNENVIFIEFNK